MIQDENLTLKQQFLEYFAEVPIQKYAAAYVARDEDTISRWKAADADFADQIERAKAEYLRQNLKQVRSKEWILERLFHDHFADIKVKPEKPSVNLGYKPPTWFTNPDTEQLEGE